MQHWKVGELARRTGLSVRTLHAELEHLVFAVHRDGVHPD